MARFMLKTNVCEAAYDTACDAIVRKVHKKTHPYEWIGMSHGFDLSKRPMCLLLDFVQTKDFDRQFFELFAIDRARGVGHQVGRTLRFRERNAVADIVQVTKQHYPAVDTQCDTAMWWRAEL